MKKALCVVVLLALSCATAPKNWDFESSRTFGKPYDKVWSAVIGFFAENTIPIKNMEKASGLIVAESQYFPKEWVDCGGTGLMSATDPEGVFNVFVTEVEGVISVKVTTSLWQSRWFGDSKPVRHNCVSTGVVETMILNYVSVNS